MLPANDQLVVPLPADERPEVLHRLRGRWVALDRSGHVLADGKTFDEAAAAADCQHVEVETFYFVQPSGFVG